MKYKKLVKIIEDLEKKHPNRAAKNLVEYDHKLDYVPPRNASVILNIKDLYKTYNPKSKKRVVHVLKGINLNMQNNN